MKLSESGESITQLQTEKREFVCSKSQIISNQMFHGKSDDSFNVPLKNLLENCKLSFSGMRISLLTQVLFPTFYRMKNHEFY